MFSKVISFHLMGIEAVAVEVETDIRDIGMPAFTIVGLAEGAVKESKERVKSALRSLDYNPFSKPITINLAPADFKKEGTHFDLPIAVGLMAANRNIICELSSTAIIGELSLDGMIRSVSGVLPIVIGAAKLNYKRVIVPYDNLNEASIVSGIEVYGFKELSEVVSFLRGEIDVSPVKRELSGSERIHYDVDFSDIKGQFAAKKATEIAAAGMHNIMFMGPPGSGKTMIARRVPTILPAMTFEEAIETTKIHSVAGIIKNKGDVISARPFVNIHPTASDVSIIGGTKNALPGAVSIAHNGVLFMDELLEFKRSVLEVLRQPMEDRFITVSRANRSVCYPANFMLVAAANPCPCGYLGDNSGSKSCICSEAQIQRYRSRLSGPLMDRIDIHITVSALKFQELSSVSSSESSEKIRERVDTARNIQKERFSRDNIYFNSQMGEKHIKKYCELSKECLILLEKANKKYNFSARAYGKLIKVARTISDLEQETNITEKHILESIRYRTIDFEG